MSQENVQIDNLLNPHPINAPSGLGTYTVASPAIKAAYVYSLLDAPGSTNTPNNFISLYNPIGSSKTLVTLGIFVSCYVASGGSTTRNSMHGHLASAISGGTLVATSAIAKFQSGFANPVAEVRTGNPTATTAAEFFQSPPPIGTTASQYVHSVGYGASTNGGGFLFLPGEGLVIQTNNGNVNQTWNVSLVWGEI